MTGVGAIVSMTALGVLGLLIASSGWSQPATSLERVVAHLGRSESPSGRRSGRATGSMLTGVLGRSARLLPTDSQLRLLGRSADQHAAFLVLGAGAGFVVPALVVSSLQLGGLAIGWYVPVAVAIAGAVVVPAAIHASTVERAEAVRTDLRFQVSAYLDVVTMLLAGNSGYEGALEHAAHAGDGRLFAELRRRMRESGARGTSLTDALRRTGADLGLIELEQVAATAALSAAEGAPVARTLAAKCATVRSALAAEQESEARLRTSRLTTPIVGMALIFMALVIYPALSFV